MSQPDLSAADGSQPNLVLYSAQGNVPLEERKTAALELMTFQGPEGVIKGPAGTGKSLGLLHRANAVLCKYAGSRGLIVRKTRSSLTESSLVTYERHVIPRNLKLYPDAHAQQRKIRHSYDYPNKSVLVVAGMDTPERVLSTEYDIILIPQIEELFEHDYELLLTRLRNGVVPYQQILGDMNPAWPNHWMNKRARDGKVKLFFSRHEDNPVLWDGEKWTQRGESYLAKLKSLSGVRYRRLFLGEDAAAEGIVYTDFQHAVHVVKPFRIPKDWRRLRVTDFGFRHPFVTQWWAISPDGVMFRYREIYFSQRIVEDHAKQINELSAGERYESHPADHDAEGRATLSKAGIRTQLAWKPVRAGIDAVTQRLREKRVFFFADDTLDGVKYGRVERDAQLAEAGRPTSTVEEFDSYVYGQAKEGTAGKEEPVKEMDDGMDCTRYAVVAVDDVARRRFKIRGGRVRGAGQLAGAR